MTEKIYILLFEDSNIIEQINIEKPESYEELLISLKSNLKEIKKDYNIYYKSQDFEDIKITNDKEYQSSKNILYIRNIDKSDLGGSDFSINIEKLDEEKKSKIEEKYECMICNEHIKIDPYLCYKCQKIIHYDCLKDWDEKRKLINEKLSCPFCRNELPLDKWQKKKNYQETRKEEVKFMNELNEIEFNKSINININKINEKNMEELKEENAQIKEIIHQIKNIINSLEGNNININELKKKINNMQINKIKNEINLIYELSDKGDTCNIFGEKFVANNKNNIEINVNNSKNNRPLVEKCKLKKGQNNIKLIIKKNKLTNLENMFYKCDKLKYIDELKYLDTKEVTNFSYMFCGCQSLNNIEALESWDVSKSTSFKNMFADCEKLIDISPLKNWNTSECIIFSGMFNGCSKLENINALMFWDV